MLTANAYGSGTITYAWSIGANTQNISSLCPGIYWVTITDSTGCQATDTAGVYNDSLTVTTSFTNPSCASCSDGVIVASATDGVPPYTFTLIPGGIPTGLNTFSGLPAGNYQVCITDAIGCASCTDDTLTTQVSDLITIQQGIVFPNPVRNEFVLKAFDFAKSKFVSMAIYDAAGKEAMAINSWKDRFNVEGLAPGIYSIKLLCEKEVAFFRFVKE
ncbi:MAG: T9SS type A sorting domain-containing protein [Bacteroidetes bacterium]|nr:T9SS type A sorting domain-containing protein [Bacteroidota bacterium]